MRRHQKRKMLFATAILAIGLLAGCSSLPENVSNSVIGEGSGSGELITQEKKSFKSDEFESIHVSAKAMEIYVSKGTDDQAEVELLVDDSIASRFTFDASIKSGVLKVDVDEKGKLYDQSFNGQKGERKLIISLPDKIYNELTINNEFGLVEASDLKMDSVDIRLSAGTIKLNGVYAKMNVETNAGEIIVEGISLENDLTAKTDAGEIAIHLNESPKAAEIRLASEVGEVTADLEHIEFSDKSRNKKIGTIGSKGYVIDASTAVGTIVVDVKK